MTTQHTPAPWIYDPQEYEVHNGFSTIHRSENLPISADEAEENARLIAASPLLLRAAKNALETLLNEYPEQVFDDYPAIAELRAAINAAEGKA